MKKPSTKDATAGAAQVGGVVLGFMAGRAAGGVLLRQKAVTDADKAKERNVNLGIRAGLAVLAIAGYAFAEANKTGEFAKSVALGVGASQAVDGVADYAKTNASLSALSAKTDKTSKIMARAIGLGCPCDGGLNGARHYHRRRLNAPEYIDTSAYGQFPLNGAENGNALDAAMAEGAVMFS